jgi:quercetin dioxygenase-like cupin family protein
VIRRVVTGQKPDGSNVFTHLDEVEPLQLGDTSWYGMWGWDQIPTLPHYDPAPYAPDSRYPATEPNGGIRIQTMVYPPGFGVREIRWERNAEFERLGAAVNASATPSDPKTGMHSLTSIIIALVVSGEVVIELLEGEETTLRPGDVCVDYGSVHAFRNRSDKPSVITFLMVGTSRAVPDESTGA